MSYVPTTPEEQAAQAHVEQAIRDHGRHEETSCPYPLRAMCDHRHTLLHMKAKGWEAPTEVVHEVFAREDCTWNYCPHPPECQIGCQHPLRTQRVT